MKDELDVSDPSALVQKMTKMTKASTNVVVSGQLDQILVEKMNLAIMEDGRSAKHFITYTEMVGSENVEYMRTCSEWPTDGWL